MIGVLSLGELELDCLLVIGGFGKIDGKLKTVSTNCEVSLGA
jgi:hypothetical protein